MNFLKGFIMWILMSTIFVSCFAKAVPVKRRMVLRLPFVQNQDNRQSSFQQRTFLRMLNGNSKIKKAAGFSDQLADDTPQRVYMFRRII